MESGAWYSVCSPTLVPSNISVVRKAERRVRSANSAGSRRATTACGGVNGAGTSGSTSPKPRFLATLPHLCFELAQDGVVERLDGGWCVRVAGGGHERRQGPR